MSAALFTINPVEVRLLFQIRNIPDLGDTSLVVEAVALAVENSPFNGEL
ncbi:MAG: hypothetical protein WBW03_01605 [Silvibacterium sp.]